MTDPPEPGDCPQGYGALTTNLSMQPHNARADNLMQFITIQFNLIWAELGECMVVCKQVGVVASPLPGEAMAEVLETALVKEVCQGDH